MEKRELNLAELEAQSVVELPDRELMGGLITVYAPVTVVLVDVLNDNFDNWEINVVRLGRTDIQVIDDITIQDINVFCNQVVSVLSAQCFGRLH